MGWFWGSSSASDDPYGKLDPKLKEFLEKESPLKYEQTGPRKAPKPSSDGAPDQYRQQIGMSPVAPKTSESGVPPESLFQDGRYAHIWKNYKPLANVESSERTEQDRVQDLIDAFKERKAQIGRAAVENCVFEQIAQKECLDRGGAWSKMTLCHAEQAKFNRCYTMQARFLKALGYLSMNRTPEEDERIQMHADKLYQEMIRREELAEEAKKAGAPEPVFQPLINPTAAAEAIGVKATEQKQTVTLDMLSPEKRQQFEASLQGLTPAERDLELQLFTAEAQANQEYSIKLNKYMTNEQIKRRERREQGRETVGDTLKRLWGWDNDK